MISQIIIKMDKNLKDRAAKKLKVQGISLSTFVKAVLNAYSKGDLEIQVILKKPLALTSKK